MSWKLTLALILAAVFVLFLLLNNGNIEVSIFTAAYRAAKGIVFFSIFVIGVIVGLLLKG
jgi:uncharacterized integral membrane protein